MASEKTQPPTSEQIRNRVHQMWGLVAESWGEHADHVEQRAEPVTRLMVDTVAPAPGDDVLELACGAGGLGLIVADRVAPGGRVVLSDVAPEMAALASQRAASRDQVSGAAAHLSVRVLDLEEIDEPDASFDIVVCREGLMFALDPVRATSEIARVLRPGGRMAVAVWGPRDRNPWLGVLADAVQQHTGVPVPPPGTPGPFSLGADGALEAALTAAGLEQISVQEVDVPTHDDSFDEYWALRTDLAGPLKKRLASLSAEDRGAIRETVRSGLAQYQTSDGLRIPGTSYVGTARRPVAHPEHQPSEQEFRTVLESTGGNNVAIVVPTEVVSAFDRGKRVPVRVTVDGGYTYSSTITSMGGRYLLSFNAETREATGRTAGDEIEVRLELDDAPRTVTVPQALDAALRSDPAAAAAWATLSYSKQKEHARSVDSAKADETRARRVDKVMDSLRA
ncbi:MAG: methyltransferase domain-containing protein [Dietzia sp.]